MATMRYLPRLPYGMSSCSRHFPKFFLEDYFRPSKGHSKREKGVRIKFFRCINNRLLWSDPHYPWSRIYLGTRILLLGAA